MDIWGVGRQSLVSVKLYVEGGGKSLKAECRKGFTKFLEKAGLQGMMPRVLPYGSRERTYDGFRIARNAGDASAMLLVDSERPVTEAGPWQHLNSTNGWDRPAGTTDDQCHLMVQVMESWFLADQAALELFYGQGFRSQALPANPNIEQVPKQDVLDRLAQATRDTGKGSYKKGSLSFEILEKLDPSKVRNASPYADRFLSALSA